MTTQKKNKHSESFLDMDEAEQTLEMSEVMLHRAIQECLVRRVSAVCAFADLAKTLPASLAPTSDQPPPSPYVIANAARVISETHLLQAVRHWHQSRQRYHRAYRRFTRGEDLLKRSFGIAQRHPQAVEDEVRKGSPLDPAVSAWITHHANKIQNEGLLDMTPSTTARH